MKTSMKSKTKSSPSAAPDLVGLWSHKAVVSPNNFKFKSLSNWAVNIAIGCSHGCEFCYVPSTSANWQARKLATLGVKDPDAEWGKYVYLREWDDDAFMRSLETAEQTPLTDLNPDGNRAVMYCSTTDPYQVLHSSDPEKRRDLQEHSRKLVRDSLELIRDLSTLNVRILTRSPLARQDFELFSTFGNRLVFGMSLPTLRNDLAKVYEPLAPAPSQRLATLKAAKKAGLHVYVAIAPTFPECDEADLRATLEAAKELDPITVFHEPINIRAENIKRIANRAAETGTKLNTVVFDTRESWKDYALGALMSVERIAEEIGLADRLHLWPDQSLGSKWIVKSMPDPAAYEKWLNSKWSRISEWPR